MFFEPSGPYIPSSLGCAGLCAATGHGVLPGLSCRSEAETPTQARSIEWLGQEDFGYLELCGCLRFAAT
jgi:hypothetical protein